MNIRSKVRITTASIIASLTLLTPSVAAAQTAAGTTPLLYFDTASLSATNGSNFSLDVRLDSQGHSINAANLMVSYPESQVQFVGLDKSGSYFDTFVPASPSAKNGKVAFAVASLGKATKDNNVPVAHLIFTAKAANGTAKISLAGSQTSNGGPAIDTATSQASVSLGSGNDSTPTLLISRITTSNITASTGVVMWHTAVPATSTVDYGSNDTYGLTATTAGLTTEHSVKLADTFSGKTTVHFKVSSTSADNSSASSDDHSFVTTGYTVDIVITDIQGNALTGTKVRVGNGESVKTTASGVATVHNVAAGNQKVYIGDAAAQIITVKAVNGKAANTPQQYKLIAAHSSALGSTTVLALLFVILAGVLFWAWRKRRLTPGQTA